MTPGAPGPDPDKDIDDVMADLDGILQDLTSGASAPAAQAAVAETRRRAEAEAQRQAAEAAARAAEDRRRAEEARVAAERRAAEEALLKAQREAASQAAAAATAVAEELRRQAEAAAAAKAAEEESRRQAEAAAAAKAAEEQSRRQAEAAAASAQPAPIVVELAPSGADLPAVKPAEEPPPVPEPAPAVPAAPPEVVLDPDPVPDKTPKEQIRRLAFLAVDGRREPLTKYARFLSGVAATVSKKPIFVHKSALITCSPASTASDILEPVQKSGAAGLIALSEGFPEPLLGQLEKVCAGNDFFFCRVPPEDAAKRTAAIGIVVDMMLIRAG